MDDTNNKNRGLMDKEQLDNLISMLESRDKENHTVALSIIEATQTEDSAVALLLGLKLGHASEEQWKTDAPKALEYAKKLCAGAWRNDLNITYKTLFTIITSTKQKPHQVKLFMEFFTEYLTNQMQSMGYTFIKEIKVITNIDE
jgi:hypothetical protein